MSKSPYFRVGDVDTSDIHDRIKDAVDTNQLDDELVIRYNKFPNKLPCLDSKLREIFKDYYDNLGFEGYRYNVEGKIEYDLFLVITPPWTTKTWTKGIKCDSSIKSNTINVHIALNDSDSVFSYFCPFNDDIISIPCKKNTVVTYPYFWGSLFKHSCTYEHSMMYLWCVMGLPQ